MGFKGFNFVSFGFDFGFVSFNFVSVSVVPLLLRFSLGFGSFSDFGFGFRLGGFRFGFGLLRFGLGFCCRCSFRFFVLGSSLRIGLGGLGSFGFRLGGFLGFYSGF